MPSTVKVTAGGPWKSGIFNFQKHQYSTSLVRCSQKTNSLIVGDPILFFGSMMVIDFVEFLDDFFGAFSRW